MTLKGTTVLYHQDHDELTKWHSVIQTNLYWWYSYQYSHIWPCQWSKHPEQPWPLSPSHKLVSHVLPEGIAEPSMPTRQSTSPLHSFHQALLLFIGNLGHCKGLDDQVDIFHIHFICIRIQIIKGLYKGTLLLQPGFEDLQRLNWLMALPATVSIKNFPSL